jgi:hypothetical protein
LLALGACSAEAPKPAPPAPAPAPPGPAAVAIAAQAGPVDGKTVNSDAFIWELVTQFAAPVSPAKPSPVVFETWASDEETFNTNPQWPSGPRPLKFHVSVLQRMKTGQPAGPAPAFKIDVACNPPTGGAVGMFPASGTPTPCVAEQVARNRVEFDYIVNNKLNTQTGLAAAYKSGLTVEMPIEAIALKGDWVPTAVLLQWIPQLGTLDRIRQLYHTTTSDSVEYALVSMHVASRQNPNWVWGTLEHEMNPGRCDYIGCYDSFGAQVPVVQPNKASFNTQYGACAKTPALEALMAKAQSVRGVEALLPEVVAGHLHGGRRHAVRARQLGDRRHRRQRHHRGVVLHRVPLVRVVWRERHADGGRDGDPAVQSHGNTIQNVLSGSRTFSFNWGLLNAPK